MSQPCNRNCAIGQPGKLDKKLGEFWVENPWDIHENHNLSCYERKRVYLNVEGGNFLDVSYLSGADNDGDGRCVVAADFRNIGRQDLVMRQVGGGPVLLYENNFPQRHYLKVSLRGKTSNRLGIGARLTAIVKDQKQTREMYPLNSYRSQMPNLVHFGLGDATQVDELRIRWPSGKEQVFSNVPSDCHIVIDETKKGDAAFTKVIPGMTIAP